MKYWTLKLKVGLDRILRWKVGLKCRLAKIKRDKEKEMG